MVKLPSLNKDLYGEWDGLRIIDGKQTFTFKRIDSTTKILKLEKSCTMNSELLKIENNKAILRKN